MILKKAVHISASPNTEFDDALLAIKLLINPFEWENKVGEALLSNKINNLYSSQGVVCFDSARTALYVLIKSLGIGQDDEVLIPSFSCHIIANAVHYNHAKNVFVDVDESTYNFDLKDLTAKLTSKTKAVIVQHTFGILQDIDRIREVVGKDVIIIEDLAHNFGFPNRQGKFVINGDYAVATFGIEKGFSGVRGGALIFRSKNEIYEKVNSLKLKKFPLSKTINALLNPVFWFITRKVYYIGWGKFVLGALMTTLARKLGILGNIIEKSEYVGKMPEWMPAKISPALAKLVVHQLDKMDRTNSHRIQLTKFYTDKFGKVSEDKILFRYPIKIKGDRQQFINKYKSKGILLGDWYRSILHISNNTLEILGYKHDCPKSELLSLQIVNFPTSLNVNIEDISRVDQ